MTEKQKLKGIVEAHRKERSHLIGLTEKKGRRKDIEDSATRLSTLEHAAIRAGAVENWVNILYDGR